MGVKKALNSIVFVYIYRSYYTDIEGRYLYVEIMSINEEEEKIPSITQLQEEEMESMAAIFADDFSLLSSQEQPISYSIHLRIDDFEFNNGISLILPAGLRLTVSYPSTYPDNDIPTFDILYDKTNITLHEIQVRAILKTVTTVAQENLEIGMPCVYSCVQAAKEFLSRGGLDQAGLALLSDDSLACILSYLATSKEDIDEICTALPIVDNAAKQNVVWKQLCQRRWKDKWGYKMRWERALENFTLQPDEHYWFNTYNNEEEYAKRVYLTRNELCNLTFDRRHWFARTPQNGLLLSGLRKSSHYHVLFYDNGDLSSSGVHGINWKWKTNKDEHITYLTLESRGTTATPVDVHVLRLQNWGWELRNKYFTCRSIDDGEGNLDELWEDLTSNIIVQKKPDWVDTSRSQYICDYREVPNDEDCKALDW